MGVGYSGIWVSYFSKILLVVYYQCCVLTVWATTRLYVIVAKSAGFENQSNGGWIAFWWIKLFCLDIFDQLVGFYWNNYSSRPHGLWVNRALFLPSASWAIDSEPIRARGDIVKYTPSGWAWKWTKNHLLGQTKSSVTHPWRFALNCSSSVTSILGCEQALYFEWSQPRGLPSPLAWHPCETFFDIPQMAAYP